MPTPTPERTFIGWDRPLAETVAATILSVAPGKDGLRDLGNHLIIAPSAFAGRLIQEAFAQQAGALLMPRITTPHHFLSQKPEPTDDPDQDLDDEPASKEAMLLAWVEVLTRQIDRSSEEFAALFTAKQKGPFESEGAIAFGQDLMKLRDELNAAASGLSFDEVAEIIRTSPKGDGNLSRVQRWKCLATLETLYLKQLASKGFADHNLHRLKVAMAHTLPAGIDTIWLACVIDPQPLLETALQNRLTTTRINVLIAADEKTDADKFNEWGRPKEEVWTKGVGTPWKDFASTVHVVRKPEDGLDMLCQLIDTYHTTGGAIETSGRLAVVPCDRETHPSLITKSLHSLGRTPEDKPLIETANPLGRRHRNHGIHHAMRALLDFVDDASFANLRRCVLHPQVATHLGLSKIETEKDGEKMSLGWHGMQRLLDAVSSATPPQDLTETIRFAEAQPTDDSVESHEKIRNQQIRNAVAVLSLALKKVNELKSAPWQQLGTHLLSLAIPFSEDAKKPAEAKFAEDVLDAIEGTLEGLAPSKPEQSLNATDVIRLALNAAGSKSFRGDMDRHAVNLPGWMEIPWEPVPHMVIFGMTDELIPGSRHAHPFLPGSLRATLGLSTSSREFANAAYTLELVRRLRAKNGRLDIIVPRLNSQNDGLRPSRLLMLSPEKDGDTLLGNDKSRGRLDHLLDEPEVPRAEPIWSVSDAMKLDPTLTIQAGDERAEEKLKRMRQSISATAFKIYLEDPSQYWMKHALGMSESKHGEMELDAAGFGTMTHAAVEAFGKDKKACELSDATQIAEVLEAHLDAQFKERFGTKPGSALLLQKGIALARLRRIAQAQAELYADGWRIEEIEGELPAGADPEKDGLIPGFKLRGRFDRLDSHVTPGPDGRKRYRVYDYKTFSRTDKPMSRHIYSGGALDKGIDLGDFVLLVEPKEKDKKKSKNPDEETPPETKAYRWKDLQLPAYHWALTQHHAEVKKGTLEVAYFCISSDPDEDPVQVWHDFERYRLKSIECMRKIAEQLISKKPETFKPSPKPAAYPTLPGLSGRVTEDYMDVSKLGTIHKA
jgi:ATP-dependent helicase/nuclease subunit B